MGTTARPSGRVGSLLVCQNISEGTNFRRGGETGSGVVGMVELEPTGKGSERRAGARGPGNPMVSAWASSYGVSVNGVACG